MAERTYNLRLTLKDYEKVQQGLLGLGAEGHRALARIEDASRKAGNGLKVIDKASSEAERALRRLAGTVTAALSVREIVRMSDSYSLMSGRLKLVTGSAEELAAVQQRLFRLAQENRAGLDETVTLYTRLAQSSDQLGLSQGNLIQLTDTVLKALRVSGATTQEAAAGVIQLAQALSAGKLQGDEFRSMLENMPRVAKALEQALGVTRGELRELSKEGQLTSQQVAAALLAQSRAIEDEFDKLPKTVGESFTQLGNSLTDFTGKNGAAQAAVTGLANALSWLSRQIDDLNDRANRLKDYTQRDVVAGLLAQEQRDLETTVQLGPQAFGSQAAFEKMMGDRLGMIESYQQRLRELENRGQTYGETFGPDKPAALPDKLKPKGKRDKHALDDYLRALEDEVRLEGMAARERAVAEKVLRAENAARRDGRKLTEEQRAQVERLAAAQYETAKAAKDAEEQSRKAAEAQKAMWRPVEQAFENIQDAFADMLMSGKWSARTLVDIFKRAAAEIAAAMVFRPIVGSVFGGLGGGPAGGLLPGVSGGVTGAAGGGGSLLSLSGLSNLGSGLLNGFSTPLINPGIAFDIGGALGLGGGATGWLHNALGNFTPLAGLASFGGGMLANVLGLSGKYSGAGGTLGGIAGTALGGPIGGAVGSFLGSALGGLFGGGKKHPGSSFDALYNGGGLASSPIVLAKHMGTDMPAALAQQLGGFLQGVAGAFGAQFDTKRIQGVFSPAGGRLQVPGGYSVGFDPNNPSSTAEAYRLMALHLAQTSKVIDADLIKALKNVSSQGKDAAGVLNSISASLSFVKGLKEFSDALTRDPSTSNESPEEIRKLALEQFQKVSADAAAGRASAQDVQAAALAYLQASQGYAGRASGVYAEDLAGVQQRVNQLAASPPRFASGGEFKPGTFIVHPDEIVMTSRTPGRVLNPRETRQALAGGSDGLAREFAAYRAQSAAETGLLKQQLEQMTQQLATVAAALRRVTA